MIDAKLQFEKTLMKLKLVSIVVKIYLSKVRKKNYLILTTTY